MRHLNTLDGLHDFVRRCVNDINGIPSAIRDVDAARTHAQGQREQ